MGLTLLKFGNPFILDRLIEKPSNILEFIYQPWPVLWGYCLLAMVTLAGLMAIRIQRTGPQWLTWPLLIWFFWQLIAATQTVDSSLTTAVLKHFSACVICYFLGRFALSPAKNLAPFWVGILAGFIIIIGLGFNQHYGGLDEMRRFFYQQPNWQQYPPEYLKKISSNRIFSSLVYPNALAGALILLLPPLLAVTWRLTARLPRICRGTLAGLLAYSGLACLYWSGSKTGWLIALILGLITLLQLPIQRMAKYSLFAAILSFGVIGFFITYASYFERGATSVGARFDYWRAAVQDFASNPVFGSGPGTFSIAYKKLKSPDSEMALLTHNDYLEQASDSGFMGFLSYFCFIACHFWYLYRKSKLRSDLLSLTVFLGVLGWALQGLTEFGLYIPALAWPAFMLLGWLAATGEEFQSTNSRVAA